MRNLFIFSKVIDRVPDILEFFPVTVELTLSSVILSLILGLLIALIQMKKIPVLKQIIDVYISIVRGTPMLVQLYVIYYGIPIILQFIYAAMNKNFDIQSLSNVAIAIVALSFNSAAYNAVTIKASIESVPVGQIEAAEDLGMNYGQILRRIIIPEMLEVAVPSIGNTAINLMKSTSLAFSCAVVECTAAAKIAAARDYRYLESYVALAIIYWAFTIILERLVKLAENSVKIPDVVDDRKYIDGYVKVESAV